MSLKRAQQLNTRELSENKQLCGPLPSFGSNLTQIILDRTNIGNECDIVLTYVESEGIIV